MAKHLIGQLFLVEVFIVREHGTLFVVLMLTEMSPIMSKLNNWSFTTDLLPRLSSPGEVFPSFGPNVPT